MLQSFIVLLPPLIVLITAALTRHVLVSLVLGILSASFIAENFLVGGSLWHSLFSFGAVFTDLGNLYLFSFLVVLGTLIEVVTHAGGVAACTALFKKFVTTRRGAEGSSLFLSTIFFLDDYLNSLMTGSIIRPLTDSMKVPRVKLAFLINSMSSPICPLIPITSWAAMIFVQLEGAGVTDIAGKNELISADPLFAHLAIVPFVFYAFFIMLSALFIVRMGVSFGAMHQQERIALETGNLYGGKPELQRASTVSDRQGSISEFLVPLASFVVFVSGFLLYFGDNWLFGGANGFLETLKKAGTTKSLCMASLATLFLTSVYYRWQRHFSVQQFFKSAWNGISLMKGSLGVLVLAFTFGNIINNDLHAGVYLGQIISSSLPLFILPLIIFLLATLTTASTGSSWGTILVLMPLTIKTLASLGVGQVPFSPYLIPVFFPSLGALIAGAVAGAHFSPITDATVVSSMSAGAYHLDHVRTQISYATPALIGACLAFLIAGMTYQWSLLASQLVSFLSGLCVTLTLLWLRNQIRIRKERREQYN